MFPDCIDLISIKFHYFFNLYPPSTFYTVGARVAAVDHTVLINGRVDKADPSGQTGFVAPGHIT